MKKKNIREGMQVKVKRVAFETGSMELVYTRSTIPKNRNAIVVGVYPNLIHIKMECSGDVWDVLPEEIQKIRAVKYYKLEDDEDCFIVRSDRDSRSDRTFRGKIVCILKGSCYPIGHHYDEWDMDQFTECDFKTEEK